MKATPYQKTAITNSFSSRRRLIAGYFIGLVACLAIGIPTARAQKYGVIDLGVVKGMSTAEPAAINNMGQVVGTSSAGTEACAFRYYNKTMQDFGGIGSRGFGISENGIVVGDFIRSQPNAAYNHATLFKEGIPIDLGVLPGALFSRANGVNSNGYVVGYSGSEFDSDNSRAFVWHVSTGMVDIGTLGGPYAQAMAVNDAGFATGNAAVSGKVGARHAFLYQIWPGFGPINPMLDLGTLGGASSYGTAINTSNHVVGYSMVNFSYGTVHAFLYRGGQLIDLGSLTPNVRGSDYSVALGINSSDQIVGYSYVTVGKHGSDMIQQAAFVYPYAPLLRMQNLNDLIGSAAKQYWLYAATSINDRGQIVACAYGKNDGLEHALLLKPITGEVPN
jgi:probable HAF family extracellular repeat protein